MSEIGEPPDQGWLPPSLSRWPTGWMETTLEAVHLDGRPVSWCLVRG